MARGATFDTDLEERVGDAIGRELRALGGNYFGGVCINLLRHPAWGRAQETYGEDPWHLGAMGAALTRGVQRYVMACVKHYALNSMENARFEVDVTISPRALHEIYLPHFRRVVAEGVASVMSAYNSVNGEWAGQNRALLTDILKEAWDFDGFVVTDFIFGMRDAKTAALAGQDVEMPFALLFARDLKRLIERGEVPAERVDAAALRVLRQQVRFGQGRDPRDYGPEVVGCEAHRKLAREAAEKSIVLLKNEGSLLPLVGVRRIAVIGRLADVPNTGDGGSSNTRPTYVVTPLEGLRASLGGNVVIDTDDGADLVRAAALAEGADVALVVAGYTHADEGEYIPPDIFTAFVSAFPPPGPEDRAFAQSMQAGDTDPGLALGGDRERLTLNPRDEALIQAVTAANPKTVVAVMAGSAVIMEAWRERAAAILLLWYPGMEGGHALADVLIGRVNPSGRLPCVFPARAEDLPAFDRNATKITYDLWHGYRKMERDGAAPAFPFGFGLSYARFDYAGLRLTKTELSPSDILEATVDVTNASDRAGEEIVQLYVAAIGSKVERAPKELKAFARVALGPGETRAVRLAAAVAELAYYDEGAADWVVETIAYAAIVGRHSLDPGALRAAFTVV
jgi:beta-glucosidase